MYLHLELKRVPADRRAEACERLTRLHGLMAAAPGFIDAQICAGIDDPSRYLVTRAWLNGEAHAAYRASPAQQDYARDRPPSLPWENLEVQEWQAILLADGSERGSFLIRSLYAVAAERLDAFLDGRRAHDDALGRDGAPISVRGYSPLTGATGEVLVLERLAAPESYEHALDRLTDGSVGPKAVERYEVAIETLPV